MKKSTVLIALALLAVSVYAFPIDIGASDAARIDSPKEIDGSAETLACLCAAVPGGGYIYVITPALTDVKVAIGLVRAKQRGVDVRVIVADRQRLEEYRERVVIYNLKHYGIPIKINIRPEPVELNMSIINDTHVVTGTCDCSPRRISDRTLTITTQPDSNLLHGCKVLFDAMWHDKHSYKEL